MLGHRVDCKQENICEGDSLTFLKYNVQDECNWILSGRDPLPDNIEEEDENTLDDISGDEVITFHVEKH